MSSVGIIKSACCARVLVKTPVYFRFTLGCIEHSTGPSVSLLQKRHQHTQTAKVVQQDFKPYTQHDNDVKTYSQADIDENIKKFKAGNYETVPDPEKLSHFKRIPGAQPKESCRKCPQCSGLCNKKQTVVRKQRKVEKKPKDVQIVAQGSDPPPIGVNALPHPIWSNEELYSVEITHKPPVGFIDKSALFSIKMIKKVFDLISGFSYGDRNEKKWIKRIVFLETLAAVPGMVAAMTRHLHSLRRLQRDYGWIHTLLEEAENERMHLMTALQLRHPSHLFRLGVVGAQGFFVTAFSVSYLLSPKFCHRFVGYLEEEAVKTYTQCLKDIEDGPIQSWKTKPAPELAVRYWALPPDATMKDVILVIRADEAHHRIVNHTLASMKVTDYNPYRPGE